MKRVQSYGPVEPFFLLEIALESKATGQLKQLKGKVNFTDNFWRLGVHRVSLRLDKELSPLWANCSMQESL